MGKSEPLQVTHVTMHVIKEKGRRTREFECEQAFERAKRDAAAASTFETKNVLKLSGPVLVEAGLQSGKTKIVCSAAEAEEIARELEGCDNNGQSIRAVLARHQKKSKPSAASLSRECIELAEEGIKLLGPAPLAASSSSRLGDAEEAWQVKLVWTKKRAPAETLTGNSQQVQEAWQVIKEAPDKLAAIRAKRSRTSHTVEGSPGQRYRTSYEQGTKRFVIWYTDGSTDVAPNAKSTIQLPSGDHADRLRVMLGGAASNVERETIMERARQAKAQELAGTSNTAEGANFCPLCLAAGVPNPHPVSTQGVCWSHRRARDDGRTGELKRKAAHSVEPDPPISDEELVDILSTARVVLLSNAEDANRANENTVTGRRLARLEEFGVRDIPLFGSQVHAPNSSCTNTVKTTRIKAVRLWLQEHIQDFLDASKRGVRFIATGKQAWDTLNEAYQPAIDAFLGLPPPVCLTALVDVQRLPHPACWDGSRLQHTEAASLHDIHEMLGITPLDLQRALEGTRSRSTSTVFTGED